MVDFVSIRLPSLPLIDNDPRTLASFTIPEVDDIRRIVRFNTLNDFAVESIVEDELEDFDFPESPRLFEIEDVVEDAVDDIDVPSPPAIDDIAREVEDRVVGPITRAVDDIGDDLTDEIDDVVGDVDQALAEEFDDVASGIQGVIDDLADVDDRIKSVGDAVSDIDVLETDQIQTAVSDGVRSAVPTVDETDLFSSPIAFVRVLLGRALDEAVSQETEDRLDDALDR